MIPEITVIICTHNPRQNYLKRVLAALEAQTLSLDQWELLLIDNASGRVLSSEIDLSWHLHARHVREETLGLTAARLCGFREAEAEILVFADDDNVLDQNYLQRTLEIMQQYPKLGAIGGKSLPEFEIEPQPWLFETGVKLGTRDLGNEVLVSDWTGFTLNREYPVFSPIGAGLVLRYASAQIYAKSVIDSNVRRSLGRTGNHLISGEDNDIVLTLLENEWGVGYFPQLELIHLIPAKRLNKNYLARLNRALMRSWVKVLDIHGIRPWQKIPHWTVLPRQMKAFFHFCPWQDPAAYVRWQGACGQLEGQADLS